MSAACHVWACGAGGGGACFARKGSVSRIWRKRTQCLFFYRHKNNNEKWALSWAVFVLRFMNPSFYRSW